MVIGINLYIGRECVVEARLLLRFGPFREPVSVFYTTYIYGDFILRWGNEKKTAQESRTNGTETKREPCWKERIKRRVGAREVCSFVESKLKKETLYRSLLRKEWNRPRGVSIHVLF